MAKKETNEKKAKKDSVAAKKKPAETKKTTAAKKAAAKIAEKEEKKEIAVESPEEILAKKPERYFEAVGRRKTATARVRLFTKAGDFTIDDKLYSERFPHLEFQKIIEDPLQKMKLLGRFKVSVKVSGGGTHSQAEAVRHGLARALVKFNADFRKRLRRAGFLRRDPRMKERKKFGLKKARRAPQWAKR